MNDRIKLWEAMGAPVKDWLEKGEIPFNPFTDANDDYAVLEWMRETYTSKDIELAFDHIGYGHRWAYETGCNAQACLALLNGEIVNCEECNGL